MIDVRALTILKRSLILSKQKLQPYQDLDLLLPHFPSDLTSGHCPSLIPSNHSGLLPAP